MRAELFNHLLRYEMWKFIRILESQKIVAVNSFILFVTPVLVNISSVASGSNFSKAIISIFEPIQVEIPNSILRLYVAAVFIFLIQLVLKAMNVIHPILDMEVGDWIVSDKGAMYKKKIISSGLSQGTSDLELKMNEEFSKQLLRSQNIYPFLQFLCIFFLLISIYLVFTVFFHQVYSVFKDANFYLIFNPMV